jgi:hypothetical protein
MYGLKQKQNNQHNQSLNLKYTVMKYIHKLLGFVLPSLFLLLTTGCDKDDEDNGFDTSGTYSQKDQMARPAINTVFVGPARKEEFNTTVPSAMSAAFKTDFVNKLTAFNYNTNLLGLTKDQFATALVTDVLNVKMNGPTTFYDGTNVLTGRALADDVIDVELTLIFGGGNGSSNPGLTRDNVNSNDKPFLTTFPYLAAPF